METRKDYQNGEDLQRAIYSTFEMMGADFSSEREFLFYLYIPDQPAAEACAQQIRALGLSCTPDEAADNSGEWVCVATGMLVPSRDTLTSIGDLMLKLAAEHGGNFDGWEAQMPEARAKQSQLQPDYSATAQKILQSIRSNYSSQHEYGLVNGDDFDGVDQAFYTSIQDQYEALGFTFIADIEDLTISNQGKVITFTRLMMHPESKATATILYVPIFETPGIFDIETRLDDGQIIQSRITAKSKDLADWPKIHTENLDPSTTVSSLYQSHLALVLDVKSRSPEANPVTVDSYDAYLSVLKQMMEYKRNYLAEIGWVTKDWLLGFAKGDAEKAEGIFAEVQNLLAREAS